jgi:hypothetical protein
MKNFEIYDFDDLTELKNNYDYSDYIIVLYNNNVWYQFQKEEQIDDFKGYYRIKLGIDDPGLQQLLDEFNSNLLNNSFKKLSAISIAHYKNYSKAKTDQGFYLTTAAHKIYGGYIWSSTAEIRNNKSLLILICTKY